MSLCGRYTLATELGDLRRIFMFAEHTEINYTRSYNIAPGQEVLVVTEATHHRRVGKMRWGLLPSWAKEQKSGYKLINARAETIAQKPAFREAYLRRRCLIPADGFYEWKKDANSKYPLRIILPDQAVFAFAGIWEQWHSPEGRSITSCCIITTEANAFMRGIHQRMPVILADAERQAIWLKPQGTDTGAALRELLQPYRGRMEAYRVSKLVNSPRVDTPECIARLEDTNQDL